jgi:aminoglycoside phosphotransferase (APT) family kinase protein
MDRYWERTIPYYNITTSTAQHLLQAVDRSWVVDHITLMPNGKRNTNYKVTLKGHNTPFLLRIFGAQNTWWQKEVAMYELVKSLVPVPKLLALESTTQLIEHPYAVYEFLDGVTLDAVTGPIDNRLFVQLGEALARLHSVGL